MGRLLIFRRLILLVVLALPISVGAQPIDDVTALAAIGPRVASTPGEGQVAAYVADRFRAIGVQTSIQPFAYTPPSLVRAIYPEVVFSDASQNVVGTIPGSDRTAGTIFVGAHLDSVPHSPGASDNASGVAALIGVLEDLAHGPRLRSTVVGIAFGAEEFGLHGSAAYVARMDWRARFLAQAMYSLDCVGRGDQTRVETVGDTRSDSLAGPTVEIAASLGYTATVGRIDRSDHASFAPYMPAALIITAEPDVELCGPFYHQPTDTPDTVDPAVIDRVRRITVAAVRDLAAVAPSPHLSQAFLPVLFAH